MSAATALVGVVLFWAVIVALLWAGIAWALRTEDTLTVEEHADEAIAIVSQGQVHSQTWSNIDELQLRRWQREHRS